MFKSFVINLIKVYQLLVSPLLVSMIGVHGCKFRPTCSEYTAGAVEKYGVIKGVKLGFKQFMKCY